MDELQNIKEIMEKEINKENLDTVACFLAGDSVGSIPLGNNKTSLFGKSFKNSFTGLVCKNYFMDAIGLDNEKMLQLHDLLLKENYVELMYGKSNTWNPKNIYSFTEKAKGKISTEETISKSLKDKEHPLTALKQSGSNLSFKIEKDQSLYDFFFTFIKGSYSHHHFDFVWQAKAYRASEDLSYKKAKAYDIFLNFFNPNSEKYIDLPDSIGRYIKQNITKLSEKLFDKAIQEVTKMLKQSPLEKFIDSETYLEFLERCVEEPRKRTVLSKHEGNTIMDIPGKYFNYVLADPKKLEYFRQYLESERNSENLNFHLAVLEYQKNPTKSAALEINENFLVGNAKTPVNIPGNDMKEIVSNLENPSPTIFDSAQKHVHKLMRADPFSRFLLTPYFQNMALNCYGEEIEKDPDVSILLRTPERYEFFIRYLRDEFNPGKIEFFFACDIFIETVFEGEQDIYKEAKTIWEDFFTERAVYKIDLPEEIFREIESQIVKRKVKERIYEKAKYHVYDSFPDKDIIEKFIKSTHLLHLCYDEETRDKILK